MAHLSHLMVCSSLYVWILCICMPDHLTPDRPTTHDETRLTETPHLLARSLCFARHALLDCFSPVFAIYGIHCNPNNDSTTQKAKTDITVNCIASRLCQQRRV